MFRTFLNKPSVHRHSTDMISLVSGVIFLGVVATWALHRADLVSGLRDWLLPLLLVGVGVIGLIGVRPRRRAAAARTGDPSAEAAAAAADA